MAMVDDILVVVISLFLPLHLSCFAFIAFSLAERETANV